MNAKLSALGLLTAGILFASQASAAPDSYSMSNGGTGSYTYWDSTYSGSGNPFDNYSWLSGGTEN
jgi:hypothetical protein